MEKQCTVQYTTLHTLHYVNVGRSSTYRGFNYFVGSVGVRQHPAEGYGIKSTARESISIIIEVTGPIVATDTRKRPADCLCMCRVALESRVENRAVLRALGRVLICNF